MFIYRHIHLIILTLSALLGVAISAHLNFNWGRNPSSQKEQEINSWRLDFNRTKKIWGVYELNNEMLEGINSVRATHAIVEKNEIHLFREQLAGGVETEILHLKLPFKATESKDIIVADLNAELRTVLRKFTGGREVMELECHKKWKTLSCVANLAELIGPAPVSVELYSE